MPQGCSELRDHWNSRHLQAVPGLRKPSNTESLQRVSSHHLATHVNQSTSSQACSPSSTVLLCGTGVSNAGGPGTSPESSSSHTVHLNNASWLSTLSSSTQSARHATAVATTMGSSVAALLPSTSCLVIPFAWMIARILLRNLQPM